MNNLTVTNNKNDRLISINGQVLDFGSLSQEILDKVRQAVAFDYAKQWVKQDVEAENFNLDSWVDSWINTFQSKQTRQLYSRSIKMFTEFLPVHILQTKYIHAQNYINDLVKKYNNNTARSYALPVSSFFSFLVKNEKIGNNPFFRASWPKKEYKTRYKEDQNDIIPVMDSLEYNAIMDYARNQTQEKGNKRIPGIRLLISTHMMGTYGLRIGSLKSLTIENNKTFHFTTKGKKSFTRELLPGTLELLKEYQIDNAFFRDFTHRKVEHPLTVAIESLLSQGKLKYKYTPHGFRHLFAVSYYRETKDLVSLQFLLGHSSPTITITYLQGLLPYLKIK